MADGIHAYVNPVQPTHRQSMVNCASTKTELQDLAAGHYTVLGRRQGGDRSVTWVAYSLYFNVFSTQVRHSGQDRSAIATAGRA